MQSDLSQHRLHKGVFSGAHFKQYGAPINVTFGQPWFVTRSGIDVKNVLLHALRNSVLCGLQDRVQRVS